MVGRPLGGAGVVDGARAAEHEGTRDPGGVGAHDVGVEAVADHQRALAPEAVQGGQEDLRVGLADRSRGRAGGVLDRGHDRARAGADAARVGEVRVAPRAPQLGPAQPRPHGGLQLEVVEAVVLGDDDDLGAVGEV